MPPPDPPSVKLGRIRHRETDLAGKIQTVAKIVHQRRLRNLEPDADHRILEQQAVFGLLDRLELGADQLHVVAIENPGIGKIDGEIQGRLPADGGQQRKLARARAPSISASMRMISSTYSRVSGSM